jgi:hypothetical protein
MEDFPPNSAKAKTEAPEDKNLKRVTSGEASRRKKPLGTRFRETFVGGDARNALDYMVFSVLIPAAKDALVDAGSKGIERLIFGDTRHRGSRAPMSGPTGYVQYNRMPLSDRPPMPNINRRARARFDFDDIVLEHRGEAEEVLERLFDLLSRYGSASVADLYELTGIQSAHTDQKWGWTELRGSGVHRVRNGYLLDLPEPEPLG